MNLFKFKKGRQITENVSTENVPSEDVIVTDITGIFPTAGEMYNETMKKWKEISLEDILKEIMQAKEQGNVRTTFYNARISDENKSFLIKKGYSVDTSYMESSGNFKVIWK